MLHDRRNKNINALREGKSNIFNILEHFRFKR
jgi:hypothetical protein